MSPIIFALISYFGWGIGDIFGTIAVRKIGTYSVTFWSYILTLLILCLYIPFALVDLNQINFSIVALNIFLGLVVLPGAILYGEAMTIGNASLVTTVAASFTALVVIFSVLFLKETITQMQLWAIIIIFLGLILTNLDLKQIFKRSFKVDKSIMLAFVVMFLWGIYFTFIKIPVRQIGWYWSNLFSFSVTPLLFVYIKIKSIKLNNPLNKKVIVPFFAGTILVMMADLSYNFAIGKGLAAVIAPIAGAYPTLFVVLAFLVFKDKITKQQIVGIITTLAGIVLLSFFSA